MLQWQWRSMIEELAELQRHASDPTCPCTLADSGEYCLQKHALGLHTLAKETIAMAPEHTEMLEQLAEEALDQHNALNERIVCSKPSDAERDTVVWSRQWRKKIEQLYYRQACKVKAGMKQELSCTLEQSADLERSMVIPKEQIGFDFDKIACKGPVCNIAVPPANEHPYGPGIGKPKFPPFQYQAEGIAWLKGRSHALLADDMGLGKTNQAIYWVANDNLFPALVVVPAALPYNWQREISEIWLPGDTTLVLDGKNKLPAWLPRWVIMSYGQLPRYLPQLRKAGFKSILIDEAHLVKNLKAQRTQNLLDLVAAEKPEPGDRPIPNRLAVTGTPMLNRPIELFALLVFLGVKARSDYKEFLDTYTENKTVMGRTIYTGAKNLDGLNNYLKSFMLRRMKKDVLMQLPPKTNTPIFVAITNKAEYLEAEKSFLEWLREKAGDEAAARAAKAEVITKMNHLRQLAAMGKVGAVCDWLKPCFMGTGKVILFSSFPKALENIKACKNDMGAIVYDGTVASIERQKLVDNFQKGQSCYFYGTIGAAGVGITLTAANRVAFLDLPWTPGAKAQAEDRSWRIGQKLPVEVVNFLARGTIDERMLGILADKEKVIAQAIDGKTKEAAEGGSIADSLMDAFLSNPGFNQRVEQYQPEVQDPDIDQVEIVEGFRQGVTYPRHTPETLIMHDQLGIIPPEYEAFKVQLTLKRAPGWSIETAPNIDSPAKVQQFFRLMRTADREWVMVVCLDTHLKLMGLFEMAIGNQDSAIVDPMEIARIALHTGATSLIIAHNHPSGDPEPSKEDRLVYERLKKALEPLSIALPEFMVVGHKNDYSFASGYNLKVTEEQIPVRHVSPTMVSVWPPRARVPVGAGQARMIQEKEPWQMTLKEYRAEVMAGKQNFKILGNNKDNASDIVQRLKNAQPEYKEMEQGIFDDATKSNWIADLLMAVFDKKPVPHRVLITYPDALKASKRLAMPEKKESVSVSGHCTAADTCAFTVKRKGKEKIVTKEVKQAEVKTCKVGSAAGVLPAAKNLLSTGTCTLHQEPTVAISGKCSLDGCSLFVKGSVEKKSTTDAAGLNDAINSAIQHFATRKATAVTAKTFAPGISTNTRYEFEFQIKDASDLIVSHDPVTFAPNPRYAAKIQPRLRERLANQLQVKKIAKGLDPEKLLMDTKAIDTGCPIIDETGLVLCGNGRVLALQIAEREYPANIVLYRMALKDIAGQYGLTVPDSMKMPVLVRLLLTPTNKQAFAEECNARPTIETSAIEKARTDADKITPAMLGSLDVLEGEAVEHALKSERNKPFVSAFLSKLPENEQALLIDARGVLNSDGVRRMGMAVFVATFRGDIGIKLAEKFFESIDDTNVKNAFNGIIRSLAPMAQAEHLVATGQRYPELAFGEDLAKTITVFSNLKAADMPVEKYLAQSQMLERQLTPFQERVLMTLDEYSRSAKRIGNILNYYAQAVIDSPPPGQSSLMPIEPPSKERLFAQAVKRVQDEVEAERESRKRVPEAMMVQVLLEASPSPEKFRAMADAMQKQIDEKRDPGVSHQNVTARRSHIAAGMAADADYLEETQKALQGMADAMEAGTLPDILKKISNKAQVEQILHHHYQLPEFHKSYLTDLKEIVTKAAMSPEKRTGFLDLLDIFKNRTDNMDTYQVELRNNEEIKMVETLVYLGKQSYNSGSFSRLSEDINEGKRLIELGINDKETFERAKAALKAYVSGPSPEVLAKKKLKELEAKIIGVKIPGFFPTPRKLAEEMVYRAMIEPGMSVLEPSAGIGSIADAIIANCPTCGLQLVELSNSLIDIMKAKKYNEDTTAIIHMDFLEYYKDSKPVTLFDRILMNPPFEHGQDVDHVKHAYALLKPGGRLIAIMGEHCFFASEKKCSDFRTWLDQVGESEKLPPGSFTGSEALVQTGTNARIVTIDKPGVIKNIPVQYKIGDLVEYQGEQWEIGFINTSTSGHPGTYRLQKGPTGKQVNRVYPEDLKLIQPKIAAFPETPWQERQTRIIKPFVPYTTTQGKLFSYDMIKKMLHKCNLTNEQLEAGLNWRPLRNLLATVIGWKGVRVQLCQAGFVPGIYQVNIDGLTENNDQKIMDYVKKIKYIKQVHTLVVGQRVFEVVVPESSPDDLLSWSPQDIKSGRKESAEQAKMFKGKCPVCLLQQSPSCPGLVKSIKDEAQAEEDYDQLALKAYQLGDHKLEKLYVDTAGDETQHKSEFMDAAKARGCKHEAVKVNDASMHFDPLLTAISCQINPATCFAQGGKPSELPVCSRDQKKDRESCILKIKETLPAGCNSKTWNKPGKPEGCVNPFRVCNLSVGCRIGKKA